MNELGPTSNIGNPQEVADLLAETKNSPDFNSYYDDAKGGRVSSVNVGDAHVESFSSVDSAETRYSHTLETPNGGSVVKSAHEINTFDGEGNQDVSTVLTERRFDADGKLLGETNEHDPKTVRDFGVNVTKLVARKAEAPTDEQIAA